jgi:hypothetical protein
LQVRKFFVLAERVNSEGGLPALDPVTRVAACAVLANPLAGRAVEDLEPLMALGATLGHVLVREALARMPGAPQAYGKAALIGVNGDLEHGAALIHPRMGKPIRDAIGGGRALIPSNVKIGGPGTIIDVPLGHRHDAWLFDYIDTLSVFFADGPRPDEIAAIVALSNGGRPRPRVGQGGAPAPAS